MPTPSFISPNMEIEFSHDWSDLQLLYTGEYNAIYTATRYSKRYVLKTLRKEYQDSLPHQELLRKEFLLGLPLEHPNIVHTLDWGQMDSIGSYIQLEFIDGVTLSAFLETKPKLKVKRHILFELLAGVEYLHQHQTIHRDIKPSNILITRHGQHVKLIDLGVADADDYVALKQPAGSYAFIAPEQLAGEDLDGRADLYSIGKVLRLLFPCRYWFIAKKCTMQKRQYRYGTCYHLQSAIHRADWCRLGLPILVLFGFVLGWAYTFFNQRREAEHLGTIQQIDSLKVTQNDQVNSLLQTIDSLNDVVNQQSAEAVRITHTMDSLENWNRLPSEQEVQTLRDEIDKMLSSKLEEITFAAQSGKFDHIKDRTTFYAPIEAWINSEKSKIHNKDLLLVFENRIEQAYYFWFPCDDIYKNLPLTTNE